MCTSESKVNLFSLVNNLKEESGFPVPPVIYDRCIKLTRSNFTLGQLGRIGIISWKLKISDFFSHHQQNLNFFFFFSFLKFLNFLRGGRLPAECKILQNKWSYPCRIHQGYRYTAAAQHRNGDLEYCMSFGDLEYSALDSLELKRVRK